MCAKFRKALILIPCCKQKTVPRYISRYLSKPLPGLKELRNKLIALLAKTPQLRERPENLRGILNPKAPLIRAVDLYTGKFYVKARRVLTHLLQGKYPFIDLLIVSALYGLVRLDEGIKEYNLVMGDKLINGMRVFRFWQKEGLWLVLKNYIFSKGITHVWSLLPNSMPDYPYHQVFNKLWVSIRDLVKCYHVEVPKAGSGTSIKRAEWLTYILENNPRYLVSRVPQRDEFRSIPGYVFKYTPC